MGAMHTKKLPVRFFTDHAERDLPTPQILRYTATHVWVRADDPALQELKSDAEHYAHRAGPTAGQPEYAGLRTSARATVRALS